MKSICIALLAGAVGCLLAVQFPVAAVAKVKLVHSFAGDPDGDWPEADLIDVNGILYGTTVYGGSGASCGTYEGCGTVFSIDMNTGAEKVLYSFCNQGGRNCTDGSAPEARLLYVNGTLFGTTASGTDYGYGTVFSVDPATGVETVIHSFAGGPSDGGRPEAGLINVNGILYGTTFDGGAYDGGTVFSINPSAGAESTGADSLVYSFCSRSNCTDGAAPQAGLIAVNGMLYGTTDGGGANCSNNCGGTVFSVNPSTGGETVLYSFCSVADCADGRYPVSALINLGGTLYGTTEFGGNGTYNRGGGGTVFSVNISTGAEAVLYNFCSLANCADGYYPLADLTAINGILYGTTSNGGMGRRYEGYGTVFSVNPGTGTEAVIPMALSIDPCCPGSFGD
jgi:uncharacterized repeat protein (TIGR03803 family)